MISISVILEFLALFAIIFYQTKFAKQTKQAIKNLTIIIPDGSNFEIQNLKIPFTHLNEKNPKAILKQVEDYNDIYENELYNTEDSNIVSVNLISPTKKFNSHFDKIQEALNVYLLRNRGAIADFNLIKDVVERNVDAEDDYITQTINAPLYLGLMGTMVGIIFGLGNLFFIQIKGGDIFESGISSFLISVCIAMIASCYGLGLTVYNSTVSFKDARKKVEDNKNDFYTFTQTELMPLINQSVSSSVFKLGDVVSKFNLDFTQNLHKLDALFSKNYDALIAQSSILDTLESIDIAEFAKANVKILKELKSTVPELEHFNSYITSATSMLGASKDVSKDLRLLLDRVNNFSDVALKVDQRLEETQRIVKFIDSHFTILNDNTEIFKQGVKRADDVMQRSMEQLKEHTQNQITSMQTMTIKEAGLLERSFEENRSYLSNLKYLEDLNESTKKIEENFEKVEAIKKQLDQVNIVLEKTSSSVERTNNSVEKTNSSIQITNKSLSSIPSTIKVDIMSEIFKNPFKKKK